MHHNSMGYSMTNLAIFRDFAATIGVKISSSIGFGSQKFQYLSTTATDEPNAIEICAKTMQNKCVGYRGTDPAMSCSNTTDAEEKTIGESCGRRQIRFAARTIHDELHNTKTHQETVQNKRMYNDTANPVLFYKYLKDPNGKLFRQLPRKA